MIFAAGVLASTAGAFSRYAHLDGHVSWLAQRPVYAKCLTEAESEADPNIMFGAAAYVEWESDWVHPRDYTVVGWDYCRTLEHPERYSLRDVGLALLVLTHESGHLRAWWWWKSEALTERWALRHFVASGVHLGYPETYVRELLYFAVKFHRELPDSYKTDGCRYPVTTEGRLVNCD